MNSLTKTAGPPHSPQSDLRSSCGSDRVAVCYCGDSAAGDSGGTVSLASEKQSVKCQLHINNAGYRNNGEEERGGSSAGPCLSLSLNVHSDTIQ